MAAVYFALYEQQFSTFIIQGLQMKQEFLGIKLLANQVEALNPLIVIIFVPILTMVYKKYDISLRTRMNTGIMLTSLCFFFVFAIQMYLEKISTNITVGWLLLPTFIMALGEIMFYASSIELFFGRSSPEIKSTIGSLFLVSIFVANLVDAMVFATLKPEINSMFFGICTVISFFNYVFFTTIKPKN